MQVTNAQTYANRPTQNTPWGSVTWDTQQAIDPATGKPVTKWTQNYNLTPEAQKALDSQMQIQQGRSDLAQGMIDRVSQEYARPFDWGSMPERGQNVGMSDFQRLGNAPQLASPTGPAATLGTANGAIPQYQSYGQSPSLSQYSGNSPQLQTNVSTENAERLSGRPDLQTQLNTQAVQNRVNLRDNGQLQGANPLERQRIEEQLYNRMDPVHQRQQSSLEVKLANQGITPGSVAYKRAMQDLGDQQSRERYDAMQTAGSEMQRLQQMALSNRQQLTNEDLSTAGLFNQANQQRFNQDLQSRQFGNEALKDMFGMDVTKTNLNNAAIQQDYNQRMGSANFANQAMKDQQGLDLARLGFNNQTAQNQQGLDLARLGFNNQAAQNQEATNLNRLNFNNQTAQNQQALDLALMGFGNQAASQQYGLNQNQAQFNNQVGQQQFNQAMQQSQYQNLLRQQAIAEEMQRRGMSLNEMNALLSGQQVQMQQMPGFNSAAASQPVQSLQAAQLQNDYNWDKYNAQAQASNSMMSGVGALAGAAMMFSDKRLKKVLGKVGKIGEFNLYRFRYLGEKNEVFGVLAQEVQKTRPDLVVQHQNGYLMVNYAGLEA